jgi:hypothetical protein
MNQGDFFDPMSHHLPLGQPGIAMQGHMVDRSLRKYLHQLVTPLKTATVQAVAPGHQQATSKLFRVFGGPATGTKDIFPLPLVPSGHLRKTRAQIRLYAHSDLSIA